MKKIKTEVEVNYQKENNSHVVGDDGEESEEGGSDEETSSEPVAEEEQVDEEQEEEEDDEAEDAAEKSNKEEGGVGKNAVEMPNAVNKNKQEVKAKPNAAVPPNDKTKAPAGAVKSTTPLMVDTAIKALNDRNGSSLVAIKQYITSNYKVNSEKSLMVHMKKYIKESITNGRIIQLKRSFKLTPQAIKEYQQMEKMKIKAQKEKSKDKNKKKSEKGESANKKKQAKPKAKDQEIKKPKKKTTTSADKENKGKKKAIAGDGEGVAMMSAPLKSTAASGNVMPPGVKPPGKITKKKEKVLAGTKKSAALQRKSIGSLIINAKAGGKKPAKMAQPKAANKRQLGAIAPGTPKVTDAAVAAKTNDNTTPVSTMPGKANKRAKK